MAEGLANKSTRNRPNNLHNAVYKAWGEGGYGMLITGNVQVDPRYLGDPENVVFHTTDLENPAVLSQWKLWTTTCQANGTPTLVQLSYRKTKSN